MKIIFVAGTDTGVGKTVITGLLASYLAGKKYRVVTQKWIQTGCRGINDVDIHLKFMGKKKKDFQRYIPLMMPYSFNFASSPHLAAKLDKKKIDTRTIAQSLQILSKNFDFVIVEGIGGLLVPVDSKNLLIDIVKKLRLPVLLVSANKLGTINHTLLSIEALSSQEIKIIGIVFNNVSREQNGVILKDNPKIIGRLSGQRILGTVPYSKDARQLKKRFSDIGHAILTLAKHVK